MESQGSARIYSLASELESLFTGGAGSPSSETRSNLSQACINDLRNGTPCSNPSSFPSLQNLSNYSTAPPISLAPSPYVLNSSFAGRLIVPFNYTYTLTQKWSNFQLLACVSFLYTCPPTWPPPPSEQEKKLVYWYALTDPNKSNSVSAKVEGGSTYIQYDTLNNSYYVPHLSDYWGFLTPQLLLHIFGNHAFGMLYANESLDSTNNTQALVNATQRLEYHINNRSIGGVIYENISSDIITPQLYGKLPFYSVFPGQRNNSKFYAEQSRNNLLFNQSNSTPPYLGNVNLFDWYLETLYASPLYLFLNSSTYNVRGRTFWTTGYHRIVYVFQDRFNNTIYLPIDADLANITTINLNVNPTVSDENANETKLAINGTVGFYRPVFSSDNFVPLKGGKVYLYYDTNLNYVGQNADIGTTTSPGSPGISAESCNAIADQLCSYGKTLQHAALVYFRCAQQQVSCVSSDPVYLGEQDNSNTTTYTPQYNASGSCSPPPKSLLAPISLPCNIYGTDGSHNITQGCINNHGTAQEYCRPIFPNGTGVCTSQLGLIGIATTDQKGDFQLPPVTACGYGSAKITAQYYGWPPPQPITADQSNLNYAADPTSLQRTNFTVLNYTWTPDTTAMSVQIGLFELSYGSVSLAAFIALVAIALSISLIIEMLRRRTTPSGKSEKSKTKTL